MAEKKLANSGIGLFALPLTVEGIDDADIEGHVPLNILRDGTRIAIPYWPSPFMNDELWISLLQNGKETRLYEAFISPPQRPVLYFNLTPEHLATDGIAFLYYQIWKAAGGNDDSSPHKTLTIDHTRPVVLTDATFPHATLWGYLNNKTIPPLTSGATVAIPASKEMAKAGDVAKVYWQGYASFNGSGPPVAGTYFESEKILQQQDVDLGYRAVVPFDPYVRLLVDNDSALVRWQLFRGARLLGESKENLVKVDRVTPGESGPFGLSTQGEMKMALQTIPKKQRDLSIGISGIGVSDAGPLSAITIDTLTEGFIAKSVWDSGSLTFFFERTPDELDGDDFDFSFGVKGQALVDYERTFPLGPIAARPPTRIAFTVPSSLFPEQPTPLAPTIYTAQIKLYKGGGGNEEASNIVEFVIDQTAPFNLKNPRRDVRPNPAPVFVNRPADAQVTVNEAWRALPANANVNITMNVGYALRRLDDHLRVWLVSGTQRIQVWDAPVPATGAISFANTVFSQLPNGRVNVEFDWRDLPGNQSLTSVPTAFLTLALAQRPLLNKAPLVPKTDPNYSTAIFLDDFAAGISAIVQNAFIEHAEVGDQIHVTIEDSGDVTNFVDLPPQPWANADLTFPLLYPDLARVFADATEPKNVTIRSTITRAGMTPEVQSPDAIFTLALDYAGPTNPDLPDLVNRAMQLPVVTGASKTPNSLLPGDRNQPGTFEVVFGLTDPEITPEQTAKCYINNILIAEYVPFTNESKFTVNFPASVSAALPTPQTNAHWTIQKSGSNKNVMSSLPQIVLVGGVPIPLPLPTIRIRNPANRDFIECFGMISPTSGYILGLQIPKDRLLPPGKTITAHFAAYRDLAGTQLITGTESSQDYVIKTADLPDVAPVGSPAVFKTAQPARGAIAFGKYWYTTDINGQQTSAPVIKPLDTISNSFNYCDLAVAPVTAP